jgi:hypothetical protein
LLGLLKNSVLKAWKLSLCWSNVMDCISALQFGVKQNEELFDKEWEVHGSNEQCNRSITVVLDV